MQKKDQGKLFCFSPPVMLVTFLAEFCMAIYTLWRYKMTKFSKLAVVMLFALGTFQFTEYMICGGLGWAHIDWARAGYITVTILPAVSIHMLVTLAEKKKPLLISLAYATCLIFAAYFLFNINSVTGKECLANYAVFYILYQTSLLYAIYYYGWLIIGIYLAWHWGMEQPKKRKALHAMMLGFLAFLVPTTTVNLIDPSTLIGLPSIMCGFAIILALIITFIVLPISCKPRKPASK